MRRKKKVKNLFFGRSHLFSFILIKGSKYKQKNNKNTENDYQPKKKKQSTHSLFLSHYPK